MYNLRTYKVLVATLPFVLPAIAFAAGTPQTFAQLVQLVISFVNPLVALLGSAALLLFFYGIVSYMYSAGEEGHAQGRERIIWGGIAIFVLLTVWSLAQLIVGIFIPGGAGGGGTAP